MAAKRDITTLTAFRGIAALVVVIFHARSLNGWAFFGDDYTAFFDRGYLWVDFFFILSGFIMAYVYGHWFADREIMTRRYGDFLIRRLRRIYPLHFFMLVLFVIMVAGKIMTGRGEEDWAGLAATTTHNLFLVQAWHVHDFLSLNQPSWSISAEWALYLVFPLVFVVMVHQPALLAMVIVLISWVGLGALVAILPYENKLDIHFDFGVVRCGVGVVTGIALWRLFETRNRLCDLIGSDLSAWLAIATTFVMLHLRLPDILVLPVMSWLLLALALNRGSVEWVFSTRPFQFLGEISYSVYMTHWFVLLVLLPVRFSQFPEGPLNFANQCILMGGMTAVTLVMSYFTWRYVEVPFRTMPLPFGKSGRNQPYAGSR